MNRFALPLPTKAAVLLLLCSLFYTSRATAQTAVFIDQAPPDTSVDCFGDLPEPIRLRAILVGMTVPPDTIFVLPELILSDSLAPCTGGSVTRVWRAGTNQATETQTITFGPDDGNLTIDENRLPVIRDTVDCRSTNLQDDPDSYDQWITDRRIAVAAVAQSDCAPIVSVTDDAPESLIDFSCGDELAVTFTVSDLCGKTENVTFFYNTVDTTGPAILGVDIPLYQLSCADDIPPVPVVTIEDCDTSAALNFTQSTTRTSSGCQQYTYTITRSWSAEDDCGNASMVQQLIEVEDSEVPSFRRPGRARLDCTQDFTDLDLTGRPTDISDNCAPVDSLSVTFTDVIASDADCTDNLLIQRTWRVTDPCGNSRVSIQEIRVVDDFAPSFDPPVATLTVACGDYTNLAVTGEPTGLFDNCDETPNTSFEDDITEGDCPGNFTVARRWRIFDDCGNADLFVQNITVIDTAPPFFTTVPEDLIGTCNRRASQQELFDDWINGFFGATYADDCVDSADITVTIVETGTNLFPTLPELSCAAQDGTVRRLSVDVTLSDPCGNSVTETILYLQEDEESVNIFNCPVSQVIPTDPDQCTARVALPPPVIQDLCVSGRPRFLDMRDTVVVTSAANNPAELGSVPVDPVILNFVIPTGLPVNAETFGLLTITMENVDAEGEDEFFNIIGEDGFLLGTTERGNVQCETVISLDTLFPQKFDRYAVDGVVTIRLEPNIPAGQPGTFAINNLCEGGTTIYAQLGQPTFRLTQIVYEVLIDDEAPILVDPIDTLFVDLDPGLHQIRYRATDCGGNTDECPFTITVEDRQAPEVFCPADIDVVLADDSCTREITVPLPTEVVDNCEPYSTTVATYPTTPADRLFTFLRDPNLNALQAQPITVVIPDVPTGGLVDILVDVDFLGRFDNNRAFLDLVTDENTVLASSSTGSATCDTPGTFRAVIPATVAQALRQANGSITLHLRPRPVTVPPGQPGDGVVPCTATGSGQTDGISRASATVTVRTLRPSYSTSGATITPLTQTDATNPLPVVTFNQGVTVFTYTVTDPSGNTGSCDLRVTVRDTTSPVAICRPTTVFVDPSGQDPGILEPSAVDGGSSDNCTISTFAVSPREFSCDRYGETETVTLILTDPSGNESSCTTIVSIAPLAPTPTAQLTECDGTELQLTANPPTVAEPGQTLYAFRWFDPSGNLISNEENPIISGVDPDDSGVYRLEIRGLTGCVAEALVTITIGEALLPPTLTAPRNVCTGDNVLLTAQGAYAGGNVFYDWYLGAIGSGTLIETTRVPRLLAGVPDSGTGDYYVIVRVSGCPTPPSAVVTVSYVEQPTAVILGGMTEFCELGTLELIAVEMAGLGYVWSGPNGYTSDQRIAIRSNLQLTDAGVYTLRTVRGGGCFSEPVSETVTLTGASPTPSLIADAAVCTSDTLILMAEGVDADTYIFTDPGGTQIQTDSPVLRVFPVGPGVFGLWTVSLQVGDCPSRPSAPVAIQLLDSPIANAMTLPDPVCTGNDLILQGGSNISGSSYRWTGPNGFVSNNIAPVIENVDSSMAGTYTLEVTSSAGCTDEESLEVDVLPGIRIDTIMVAEGRCLNGGETVALIARLTPAEAALNGSYTFQWSGPQGTSNNDTLFIPNVSLASNGTYSLTVSNTAGCNSPAYSQTLELDFAPAAPLRPFTSSGDYSICSGETVILETNDFGPNATYLWRLPGGTNIPTTTNTLNLDTVATGSYTVRVVRGGCSSLPSASRVITVTPFPVITASSDGIACSGQPINFQATDLPGATYAWRGPNNFSSSLPNPTIARANPNVHAGRYSVVATINGCPSDTMFLEVEVLPTPSVPVPEPITAICLEDDGAVLELNVNPNTATAGATYIWTINNGQTVVGDPTTDLRLSISDFSLFEAGGVFDFRVQASLNGCVSEASTVIVVRLDRPGSARADAGMDTTICAGLYLLEAEPVSGVSGRWSLVTGNGDIAIVNPTSNITAVTGLTEFGGPYEFAWTLSNGSCRSFSADTVRIAVTDGEEALAGEDFLACVREEVRLGASDPVQSGSAGVWSQAQAQELLNVVIVTPNDPNTVITGLQPDNIYSFTWTVRSNCGVKSDNVLVNVSDPTPFAGEDDTVCNLDRTAVLVADEPTLGSEGRWRSLNEIAIVVEPESPTSMVTNLQPGENRFLWEIDEGFCGNRSRDTVSILYRMPAETRDDEVIVPFQGTATFDPRTNDLNLDGATVTFPNLPSRGVLTDNGDGTFTFRAPANFVGEIAIDYEVTSVGCSVSTATVFAIVGDNAECRAPNIFTPNNDGVNDFFVVPCLLDATAFPESQVTIYNQWGDEVYRSGIPYRNDWDGTHQGNTLPVGTYFFIIDFGGTRENESGDVRIER